MNEGNAINPVNEVNTHKTTNNFAINNISNKSFIQLRWKIAKVKAKGECQKLLQSINVPIFTIGNKFSVKKGLVRTTRNKFDFFFWPTFHVREETLFYDFNPHFQTIMHSG